MSLLSKATNHITAVTHNSGSYGLWGVLQSTDGTSLQHTYLKKEQKKLKITNSPDFVNWFGYHFPGFWAQTLTFPLASVNKPFSDLHR